MYIYIHTHTYIWRRIDIINVYPNIHILKEHVFIPLILAVYYYIYPYKHRSIHIYIYIDRHIHPK
jgi:hypothetical protein